MGTLMEGDEVRYGARGVVVDAGNVLRSTGRLKWPAPSSLPAVCRVLHPWLGTDDQPVRWQEVADELGLDRPALARRLGQMLAGGESLDRPDVYEPLEGALDAATAGCLASVLERGTTSPEELFLAVWTGYGEQPQRRRGTRHLVAPRPGLAGAHRDRLHWTFVAGSDALIAELLQSPELEVVADTFDGRANELLW